MFTQHQLIQWPLPMSSVIQQNSLFQLVLFPPISSREQASWESLLRKRVIEHVLHYSITHVEHPRVGRGCDRLHSSACCGAAPGERAGGRGSPGQCLCGGNDLAEDGPCEAHGVLPTTQSR